MKHYIGNYSLVQNKCYRIPKMDNPEKLATYCTQDEDKQSKTHNTICVVHTYAQASTNNVNKT